MKKLCKRYRALLASATLCSAILVMASSVHGALLFSDDFESYSLNASLQGTPNWPNTSTGSGFTANVVNGGTPFGTSTQYLDFNDASASGGLRVLSGRILAPYNVVTTFSFDFYEPADGGSSTLNAGYAAGTDLGTGTTRNRFSLSNGTIGVGITGTSTSYNLDTPYRIYMVFNDTSDAITFESQTIAAGAAGIWYEDLNAGSGVKTFAGISTYSDAAASTLGYAVGFRSWSSALQRMYVDNVSWYAGASFTPPAPPQILYWDGTPGTPDGASSGGSGTWSTNDANWDTGAEYVAWDNTDGSNTTAVINGANSTIALGDDITLNAISLNNPFSLVRTYNIGTSGTEDNTLNFEGTAPKILSNAANTRFYSGITGKPDIDVLSRGTLILQPAGSLTMDLGKITHDNNNFGQTTQNTSVNLEGSSINNSCEEIHYKNNSGNNTFLYVTKLGAGTWNVGSLYRTGSKGVLEVDVNAGTLVSTGTWSNVGSVEVGGGRLAGTVTIGTNVTVTSGSLAPGAGVPGTLTVNGAVDLAGTLLIDIDDNETPNCDKLAVSGDLDISTATLTLNGTPGQAVYVIASYGTLTGAAFAATNGLPANYEIDYDYAPGDQIAVVRSEVEPTVFRFR